MDHEHDVRSAPEPGRDAGGVPPSDHRLSPLLSLQRAAGNAAVNALLQRGQVVQREVTLEDDEGNPYTKRKVRAPDIREWVAQYVTADRSKFDQVDNKVLADFHAHGEDAELSAKDPETVNAQFAVFMVKLLAYISGQRKQTDAKTETKTEAKTNTISLGKTKPRSRNRTNNNNTKGEPEDEPESTLTGKQRRGGTTNNNTNNNNNDSKDERRGEEEDDDQGPTTSGTLGSSGGLSQRLLALEEALEAATDAQVRKKVVKSEAQKLIPSDIDDRLDAVLQLLDEDLDEGGAFQIIRFSDTFECGMLSGTKWQTKITKITKVAERAIKDRPKERQKEILRKLHQKLLPLWPCDFDVFRQTVLNAKRGRHGTTDGSAKATWAQLLAAIGEIQLMLPTLFEIDEARKGCSQLLTWDIAPLVLKVLQGSTRRFKVVTIRNCLLDIAGLQPTLLKLEGHQITPDAMVSIRSKLGSLVGEFVAGKSKEQVRQLQVLIASLMANSDLVCVGYEAPTNGADADIVLATRGHEDEKQIVLEVEGLPGKTDDPVTYYKGRWDAKMETIGSKLLGTQTLHLAVPVDVELTEEHYIALEKLGVKMWRPKKG